MFCFRLIHTIHNHFPENVQKLYTSTSVRFTGKSSYTPTYPHYPHFFSVYHQFSPDKEICGSFCTHLINFPFSTKNTRFCLDRLFHPTVVCQPGFKEKKRHTGPVFFCFCAPSVTYPKKRTSFLYGCPNKNLLGKIKINFHNIFYF